MKEAAKTVIDRIPSDYYAKLEAYVSEHIILYKPVAYISGMELSSSDYYHVILPASDPPPTKVADREYQFKKGRLIVFVPGTVVHSSGDVPSRQYIALCIEKNFFGEIARETIGKKDACFSAIDYPCSSKLANLIESFEEEFKRYNESCPLMLHTISTQIVIQILRDTGNTEGIEVRKPTHSQSYAKLAMDYMLAYYNSNIKIEDISKQIHLSPRHFIRMFKETTGKTPHEYLLALRISKAEELLSSGSYTVEEAARNSGFVNAAHFSNYFKRIKGITPSDYRKKYFNVQK